MALGYPRGLNDSTVFRPAICCLFEADKSPSNERERHQLPDAALTLIFSHDFVDQTYINLGPHARFLIDNSPHYEYCHSLYILIRNLCDSQKAKYHIW